MNTRIIVFYHDILTIRGSCVALIEYIKVFKRKGWTCYFLTLDKSDQIALNWIEQTVKVYEPDSLPECYPDILWILTYGNKKEYPFSGMVFPKKTVIQCIFDMSFSHGDYYVGVSRSLALKYNKSPDDVIPHIVPALPSPTASLRSQLGIPLSSIVFGRYGGLDTFNIPFSKLVISEIVQNNPNIYFLFMNTPRWGPPSSQIIYVSPTTDPTYKSKFISTCDAMIVPEQLGHTFGLSIAEFCSAFIPIICYDGTDVWNTAHIYQLKKYNQGIFFQTESEFRTILLNFEPGQRMPVNPYSEFSVSNVFQIINNKILLDINE